MKRWSHWLFVAGLALAAGCGDDERGGEEGCTEEEEKKAEARCQQCLDSCSGCNDPGAACTASCRPCDE